MSKNKNKNKGKDGEACFAIALLGASIREDGLEFTRHTPTNQPDSGEDCHLQGPGTALVTVFEAAKGESLPELADALGSGKTEARFELKTTTGKLTLNAVNKFVSDTRKHPNTKVHALVGGSGFTKSASQAFSCGKDALKEDGKHLLYLSIEDVNRLQKEYNPEINTPFHEIAND